MSESDSVPIADDRRILWLASYPKSGNTWVRALLGAWINEGPVNINAWPRPLCGTDLTYAHYSSASPRPLVMLSPAAVLGLRGSALQQLLCAPDPVFCKTHSVRGVAHEIELIPHWLTRAAVCIVRNPFDVAVSLAHHMDVTYAEAVDLMTSDNALLSKHGGPGLFHVLASWATHVRSWRQYEDTLVVRYEDLLEDAETELQNILMHFGLYDGDDLRVSEAVANAAFDGLRAQEEQEGFEEARNGVFFRAGRAAWGASLPEGERRRLERALGGAIYEVYPELEAGEARA